MNTNFKVDTRLEEALERIRQLEDQLGYYERAPVSLGLTPSQYVLLGGLLKRDRVTKEHLLDMLLTNMRYREGENLSPKIVHVHILHMRRKLSKLGVEIHNQWGWGYWISPEDKKKIRDHHD